METLRKLAAGSACLLAIGIGGTVLTERSVEEELANTDVLAAQLAISPECVTALRAQRDNKPEATLDVASDCQVPKDQKDELKSVNKAIKEEDNVREGAGNMTRFIGVLGAAGLIGSGVGAAVKRKRSKIITFGMTQR